MGTVPSVMPEVMFCQIVVVDFAAKNCGRTSVPTTPTMTSKPSRATAIRRSIRRRPPEVEAAPAVEAPSAAAIRSVSAGDSAAGLTGESAGLVDDSDDPDGFVTGLTSGRRTGELALRRHRLQVSPPRS